MGYKSIFGRRFCCITAIFFLYISVSIPLFLHTKEILYINMVWNVFLAFLPLLFSNLLFYGHARWGWVCKGALGILWLLFFPNAPYMITDFIHISGYDFYLSRVAYSEIIYSTDMTLWIRIVYIGIGVFMGILSGMLSLRMIHILLRRKLDAFYSWCILLSVFLLTGYGIFLGRFLRLNSWNIIKPRKLLLEITDSVSMFSLKFTILYAFFVGAVYVVFFLLCPTDGFEASPPKAEGNR